MLAVEVREKLVSGTFFIFKAGSFGCKATLEWLDPAMLLCFLSWFKKVILREFKRGSLWNVPNSQWTLRCHYSLVLLHQEKSFIVLLADSKYAWFSTVQDATRKKIPSSHYGHITIFEGSKVCKAQSEITGV